MNNRDELDKQLNILPSNEVTREPHSLKWHKFGKDRYCLNKLKLGEAYLMACHDEVGILSIGISCLIDDQAHIFTRADWDLLLETIYEANFTPLTLNEITTRLPRVFKEQISTFNEDKRLNSLIQTDQPTEQLGFKKS